MRTLWKLTLMMTMILTLGYRANAQDSLRVGMTAPDFRLPYATADTIALDGMSLYAELERGPILLAFYPADWSGGCTREVCSFRDAIASFEEVGLRVWGISGDYVYSHHEWARHHSLPFELLSDHDHAVARAYGSFNPQRGFNRRTVFVIGKDRRIVYVDAEYSVADDADFRALKAAVGGMK